MRNSQRFLRLRFCRLKCLVAATSNTSLIPRGATRQDRRARRVRGVVVPRIDVHTLTLCNGLLDFHQYPDRRIVTLNLIVLHAIESA